MALVANDKIMLLLNEEELDVLLQAVGSYRGPYAEGAVLNDFEKIRKELRLQTAAALSETLEAEALRRYHEKEAHK